MAPRPELKPARELALQNGVRFPNESDDYRRARDALLLRAGRILDRSARRRYLTAVPLNARVLVLSRRWLADRGSEDEGLDGG